MQVQVVVEGAGPREHPPNGSDPVGNREGVAVHEDEQVVGLGPPRDLLREERQLLPLEQFPVAI